MFGELCENSQTDFSDAQKLGDECWFDGFQKKCFVLFIFAEVTYLWEKFHKLFKQVFYWFRVFFEALGQYVGQILAVIGQESYCLFDAEVKVLYYDKYKQLQKGFGRFWVASRIYFADIHFNYAKTMCTFLSTTIVLSFQLVENVVNDLVIAVQNFRFILLSDLNAYFLQLIAKYRD